jgi:hypothetical protein
MDVYLRRQGVVGTTFWQVYLGQNISRPPVKGKHLNARRENATNYQDPFLTELSTSLLHILKKAREMKSLWLANVMASN